MGRITGMLVEPTDQATLLHTAHAAPPKAHRLYYGFLTSVAH
jgi:hypothetical protein